jgi:hypothetical protein
MSLDGFRRSRCRGPVGKAGPAIKDNLRGLSAQTQFRFSSSAKGTSGPGAPFGCCQSRCPDPPLVRDRGLAIAFDPNEVLRLLANKLGYYATTEIVVTLKLY